MLRPSCIYLICLLASLTTAYTTFDSECSVPTSQVNFVSAPDTRGTLQILWSSLFTILACTWTVLHLNVPPISEEPEPDAWFSVKRVRTLYVTYKPAVEWFLMTLIAPEITLAKYSNDTLEVYHMRKKYLDVIKNVNWTRTHVIFAHMGGFVLRLEGPAQEIASPSAVSSSDRGEKAECQHDVESKSARSISLHEAPPSSPARGGEADHEQDIEAQPPRSITQQEISASTSILFYVNADELLTLMKEDTITLPKTSEAEINDRSKTDPFVRVLAVGQIAWVVIQIIVRYTRHIAVTQLEVTVLAFAVCAIVMYLVNVGKPRGVNLPIEILPKCLSRPEDVIRCLNAAQREVQEAAEKEKSSGAHDEPSQSNAKRQPGQSVGNSFQIEKIQDGSFMMLLVSSILFGGLHLIAWHFDFPTRVEQILWRVAALICVSIGPAICVLGFLVQYLDDLAKKAKDKRQSHSVDTDNKAWTWNRTAAGTFKTLSFLLTWSALLLTLGYILARLYLLVEVFRALCYLPPSAYIGTWAGNLPNID